MSLLSLTLKGNLRQRKDICYLRNGHDKEKTHRLTTLLMNNGCLVLQPSFPLNVRISISLALSTERRSASAQKTWVNSVTVKENDKEKTHRLIVACERLSFRVERIFL